MSSKVMKRIAIAALMLLMVCVLGSAMAETVETASVVVPMSYTYTQDFIPQELKDQIQQEYENEQVTLENLNEKYSCAYTIDTEHESYFTILDTTMLQFTAADGSIVFPVLKFRPTGLSYTDTATITTSLTDATTGENLYTVKNTVSMASRVNPVVVSGTENKIASEGRYSLSVEEGAEVTIQSLHKSAATMEEMDLTYEWSIFMGMVDGKPTAEMLSSVSNTCTFTIKPEYNGKSLQITAYYADKQVDNIMISLTVLEKDEEQLPTLSVTTSVVPAAENGIITVTEGADVVITALSTCSDESVMLSYKWFLNDEWISLPFTTSSYAFKPALEQDGAEISVVVTPSKAVEALTATHVAYTLNVQAKPLPTLSATANTLPAAENGVITVTEGDQVQIEVTPACSDASLGLSYEWKLDGETLAVEGNSYAFAPMLAQNGKTISVSVIPASEVNAQTATTFSYTLNVQSAPVIETITWPVLLNGAGTNSSRINLDDNKYLSENYLSKYNHNDLTMEYSAGKGITVVEASPSRIKFEATKEANGEFLTVTLTNPAGETYIGKYQFMVDSIYKGVTVNAASGAVLTEKGTAFYELTVKEGTTLTVTTNYEQLNGQKADMTYAWELARKPLNNAGNSYTFTVGKEHAGTALTIFAQSKKNPQCLNQDIIELVLESAEPIIKVEYEEGIPQDAITETAKEEIAETLTQNSTVTKEEIEEKGIVAVIEETMEETVVEKAQEIFKNETTEEPVEIPVEQTAVYEVTLMYTEDGGRTWEKADEEHWPENGKLDVVLPYPEGTNRDTTKFVVAHMFTKTTADHKAGDIEYPAVSNMEDGIHFQVSGLSPIALAWTYEPAYETVATRYESGLPAKTVTDDLKRAGLNSVALIKTKLETELVAKALSMGKTLDSKQIVMTDVTLRFSADGKKTWQDITINEWPSNTVSVFLRYPEGTNANTHDFMIAHMIATGPKAGQIEYLDYVPHSNGWGMTVEVTSMSPFAIAYFEKPAAVAVPATGDSATPYLWLLGMIIAAAGCAVIINKRRQNG